MKAHPAASFRLRRLPRFVVTLAMAVLFSAVSFQSAWAQGVSPTLGNAKSFAILAGTPNITNTTDVGPATTIKGDVGIHPALAITGFPPGLIISGTFHGGGVGALNAKADALTAYNNLAGQTLGQTIEPNAVIGAGEVKTAGIYTFDSSNPAAQLNGALTLDAQGDPNAVFIFKIASTLNTAADASVLLTNGAQPCNVWWQVGSGATIGVNTSMIGNILGEATVALQTNATLNGRAFSNSAAVTLDHNTVAFTGCAPNTTGNGDKGPIPCVDANGNPIANTQCDVPVDIIPVNEIRVHVAKYIGNALATSSSAGGNSFPMTATWNAPNTAGTGTYSLGPTGYTADTDPLQTPVTSYQTSEITTGPIVVASLAQCVPGSYYLDGYSHSNSSFATAANGPFSASVILTNLTADEWIVVRNQKCPAIGTGTLVVKKTTINGNGTFGFTGGMGSFSIGPTVANAGTKTFNNVAPGQYTIAEASPLPSGWTQTSPAGSCTVTVEVDKTATCEFTNTLAVITPPAAAKLEIGKTANTTTYDHVGQVITYTYTVKNTGNVSLTGPFKVTDDKLGTFTCGSSTAVLAVNESVTCTKTYTVQATNLCGTTSWQQGKTANIDTGQWLSFTKSTQDTKITNHQGGLPNGTYPCWCIQDWVPTDLHGGLAKLFSTLGTGLPADVAGKPWNKVNWVLNNKGIGSGLTFLKDVQTAIWVLTGEKNPEWGISTRAKGLIDGANAHSTYLPEPGGISAVIVYSDGMLSYPQYKNQIQESICEVKCSKTIVNKATASVLFRGRTVASSNQASVTVSAK